MPTAVMVHQGAWVRIPDSVVEAHARGCLVAVKRGFGILYRDGTALDAVEGAILCASLNGAD